jgi:SRP54-type protein, GTPase domain
LQAFVRQVSDFGPKTALKVVDGIREKVLAGQLKTGPAIREELKRSIVAVLRPPGGVASELDLGDKKPGVILVVGVNGSGKTTTIGKLSHKFRQEGAKVGRPSLHKSHRAKVLSPGSWQGHLARELGRRFVAGVEKRAVQEMWATMRCACAIAAPGLARVARVTRGKPAAGDSTCWACVPARDVACGARVQ